VPGRALAQWAALGRAILVALDYDRVTRVAAGLAFESVRESGFTVEPVVVTKPVSNDTAAENECAGNAEENMKGRFHSGDTCLFLVPNHLPIHG